MILLDTDHLTVLKYDEHPECRSYLFTVTLDLLFRSLPLPGQRGVLLPIAVPRRSVEKSQSRVEAPDGRQETYAWPFP
jgi:hypothetical protein